jgi:O-antigen ligase
MVVAFVGMVALEIDTRASFAASVTVGALSIYLVDVLAVAMLVVGAARLLTHRLSHGAGIAIAGLLALTLVNSYRGQRVFGVETASADSRGWIYLLAPILFAATAPVLHRRWWIRMLAVYVGLLLCAAVVGIRSTGLRMATDAIVVDGAVLEARPVTASGALIVAEVLVLVVAACLRGRKRLVPLAALLLATTVLLQQRTVWLAAVTALAGLGISALARGGRTRLAGLLGLGAVGFVLAVGALTSFLETSVIGASAEDALSSDNTFTWRLDGWRALLAQNTTAWDVVLGRQFGAGFIREINGTVVTVAPHSHYVEAYLRFGLVGLVLTGVLVAACWRGAAETASRLGTTPGALRAVLVLLLVFGVSYRWDPVQGIALGVMISTSLRVKARAHPPPTASAAVDPRHRAIVRAAP